MITAAHEHQTADCKHSKLRARLVVGRQEDERLPQKKKREKFAVPPEDPDCDAAQAEEEALLAHPPVQDRRLAAVEAPRSSLHRSQGELSGALERAPRALTDRVGFWRELRLTCVQAVCLCSVSVRAAC